MVMGTVYTPLFLLKKNIKKDKSGRFICRLADCREQGPVRQRT